MKGIAHPVATTFEAGVSGKVELDDFDAIHEVSPAWEQRHQQIGVGRTRVRIVLAQTSRLQLAFLARSPGVFVRGAPPPGASLLTALLHGPGLHVQGVPWDRDHLGVVPRGGEFEVTGTEPHAVIALSVDPALLDQESRAHWGMNFPSTGAGPRLRLKDEASRRHLISTWARWLAFGCRHPGGLVDALAASLMEAAILGAVFDSIDAVPHVPPSRPRREVAQRAERFIRESLAEDFSVDRICEAISRSPGSLHRSFRAEYGITPMAYRKALRLDACRRDLLCASPGTTVSAVAAKWGFFRFGYFSADYRGMFGENPHETLRRARGTRAPPASRRGIDPA